MKLPRDLFLLYGITDDRWIDAAIFYQQVEAALQGGVTCLQYRDKIRSKKELKEHAKVIRSLCDSYHVPFIMNDNADMAKELCADGVHVGQMDMSVAKARQLLGEKSIIGASARTVEQARIAKEQGADYLGVGAVFQTTTKTDARQVSHEQLVEISSKVHLPVVAIGGITSENLPLLTGTGIEGFATVSAIFQASNIQEKCQELLAISSRIVIADHK